LSASIQAIIAAEVGHLDLAYDCLCETAFSDLYDRSGNTADGLHLAALAGALLALIAGFGGMRDYGDTLAFAPRVPSSITRLSFRLLYRGRRVRIDIGREHARYELLDGEVLDLLHHGERFTLMPAAPQTLTNPLLPEPPPVEPPPGRAAGRRRVSAEAASAPMTPPRQ
jgi:alpha,alpha-trehalose phosphorylase